MIAEKTLSILKQNNLSAKKTLGQNFLISKGVLERICDVAKINKDDMVIEVGPGLGALTEFLVARAKKVICYEIDVDMCKVLSNNFADCSNLQIIQGDFLDQNLNNDIANLQLMLFQFLQC